MTREKTKASKESADALASFRKLTKADALLFYVIEILKGMKLKTVAAPIEGARREIARRLEACQDVAYVQMKPGQSRMPSRTSARAGKGRRNSSKR
jgi:hypothetical protein